MTGNERVDAFRERRGGDPPSFLTISPTKKCNLRCKGCYAASSAKNDECLRYSVLARVIREKTEVWGSHFTVLSGGEPLMYVSEGKDLFDLLGDNQDNYFMMYTNGTLITREVAERMADLGNISPAISVEGWERETDDRRGKGVFRRVQEAMQNLRAAGVPFGISVTATRENAEVILSESFLDFYFGHQGALYGWIFQYMPIGRGFTADWMVTPEQRRWMLEQELSLLYDKKRFLVDFWNGGPMTVGCIAAGRPGGYFYVDWNGNIAPCVFFPYYVDNLYGIYANNLSLTDVLESGFFQTIRRWQDGYAYKQPREKMGNLFLPCAIRDHYRFASRAIENCGAHPMDEDAGRAIVDRDFRESMVRYDERLEELIDPIWERDVLNEKRSAGGQHLIVWGEQEGGPWGPALRFVPSERGVT
jgi:MoaA/NifB/PqqE/SkfB family radical SAM enzyme